MSLASPIWLLLLIPWLAVLFYLLLGKPPREQVPFLWLWRGPEAKRKAKPSLAKLPLWIALLMLAGLAAIVSAAGPQWQASAQPLAASRDQVGIAGATVRGHQVMVRILNESPGGEATIKLTWSGGERAETLQLPATGEQAYFIDLPTDPPSLRLTLDQQTIELARQRTWPKIEARMPMPDELRRMLTTYAHHRPAGDDSRTVAIAPDEATLGADAGVILAEGKSSASGKVSVMDHAVARSVDWNAVLADRQLAFATTKMPSGFDPLVSIGDVPVVAVRESPRQVWVGFASPSFPTRVDYVVFWTNVFDFTGEGADEWKPAPGSQFVTPQKSQLVQIRVQNLAPWFVTGALSLTLIALLTAQRRGQLR